MQPQKTPQEILKSVFGYDSFKTKQREVIENVLKKRDTLAIMPTGGGKSLCYQIPALIFPGLTVVVSPLIALMKDQVEQLTALGVPALFLNSSLSLEEYQLNMALVRGGEVKLLYVAPETLLTPRILNMLSSMPLDCLTIDEAHCISEWGHDFRPEYRQIAQVRKRFPQAVCLALTATATERVRQDIQGSLSFATSNEFIASFNRENLFIEVTPKVDPAAQTLEFLQRFPQQAGIIYCFSRKQVDDLADFLARKGFAARPYHAGLDDAVRKRNQDLFVRDDIQIMVATIAFGMGINKPNVRFVLHYDLPKSIEGYYQEIGRSGRDGLPSHCLLLYSGADTIKQKYFIKDKEEQERLVALQHLNALVHYAESTLCRRSPLLNYFGEPYEADNCGMCDNCTRSGDSLEDITIPVQKFLSCVKRTGERFAATHVIHVLLGTVNEKVERYNHQQVSTFGIGKELNEKQWQHIARQLVEKGLLERSPDIYQTLRVTPQGYEILKNRETIMGTLISPMEQKVRTRRSVEVDYDPVLFDLLRKKRKELAEQMNLPPYVIFSDKTLVEMAAYYPMSQERMLQVYGVGQKKFADYGAIFIDLIQAYCRPLRLQEKRRESRAATGTGRESVAKLRHVEVGELYNEGRTIPELMEQYHIQQGTILDHLARYRMEGNPLRRGDEFLAMLHIPLQQQLEVLKAFEEQGSQALKPVFDRMNGLVSYDDLKILRLHYLIRLDSRMEKNT